MTNNIIIVIIIVIINMNIISLCNRCV